MNGGYSAFKLGKSDAKTPGTRQVPVREEGSKVVSRMEFVSDIRGFQGQSLDLNATVRLKDSDFCRHLEPWGARKA